jgi:RHS repeat-associated protein
MTSLSGAPSGSQLNLSFVYDYMGRRIQKVVSTNSGSGYVVEYTDNYAYDGWNCVAVLNSSLSLVSSFLWGTDLSGSMQGAGGVGGLVQVNYYGSSPTNCFVAYDGNGNVVALVNAADGSTLSLYEYGPFGELIRATGPMAKLNPFRFSTKYDDDESDLLYYGYRYYNASTGRWLSRDPLGSMRRNRSVQASWQRVAANEYLFVQNDSCDLIDALGLDVYKVRISTSRCFDHRAVIGDVGDGKHSYYLDVYGIDGKNSCGCPVCSGASGFRYTLLSWPASQAVHQSIFNNNMRPVGHVVTHSDVDAQLNEIAQNKPGQLWNYKFILHDCGNFANEWLHFARELEWEEHGDTPYPPF